MKNNKLISLFLALLVCFTLVVTVSATSGNQNLAIAVEGNTSTVVYGNTIKVSVMINENPGNLGINFDVKWDTSVLTYVSNDATGSAFSNVKIVPKDNRVVFTVGDPSLGLQYPQLATKITGTGKIVDLVFKVKDGANADTETLIYFDREEYVDLNGKPGVVAKTDMNLRVIASNHTHTPGAAATCTTDQICTVCNAVLVKAEGHKPGAAATCTTNQTCTVCKTELVKALGHTPGAAATCTTAQTCTVCKAELAKALGHTPGAAATCTTAQSCTVCKAELAKALGHTPGAAATCTTAQTCTVCKAELAKALGHTPGAAATCTTAQTCTVCKAELVKALGHTPGAAATCTTNQTCTVCKAELVKASGHKAQNLPSKVATCTETGLTQGSKCETCGEVLKAQETIAAIGHDWNTSWVNSSSSGHFKTCKNCGEKKDNAAHTMADGVCSVCGFGCKHTGGTATCSAQAVCTSCNKPYGDLLAHTPGAEATCAAAQTCTVCNVVIVEKLDHDLEFVNAKEVTCGAAGWAQYEKCKNCTHTTYKEIPATGNHSFGDWNVVTEATTKAAGEQTRTCKTCNFVESEVIPVLPAPEIPVLWIIVLVVLVAAVIVVFILITKKKN